MDPLTQVIVSSSFIFHIYLFLLIWDLLWHNMWSEITCLNKLITYFSPIKKNIFLVALKYSYLYHILNAYILGPF